MAKRKTSSRKSPRASTSQRRARTERDETVTISKTAIWQIVAGVLGLALIVAIVLIVADNDSQLVPDQPGPRQPGTQQPGDVEISLEGAHTLGDEDSDILFAEYSSFTCPYCGRHHEQTHPSITENYIENGRIQYVYKHFVRNQQDLDSANAAECAGEQGAFFEFSELIYSNQQTQGPEAFTEWAQDLGLDMDQFDECVSEGRYQEKAMEDLREGQSNGITGTPGFIINGKMISGACPYQTFQTALDREIAGEDWSVTNCQVV